MYANVSLNMHGWSYNKIAESEITYVKVWRNKLIFHKKLKDVQFYCNWFVFWILNVFLCVLFRYAGKICIILPNEFARSFEKHQTFAILLCLVLFCIGFDVLLFKFYFICIIIIMYFTFYCEKGCRRSYHSCYLFFAHLTQNAHGELLWPAFVHCHL